MLPGITLLSDVIEGVIDFVAGPRDRFTNTLVNSDGGEPGANKEIIILVSKLLREPKSIFYTFNRIVVVFAWPARNLGLTCRKQAEPARELGHRSNEYPSPLGLRHHKRRKIRACSLHGSRYPPLADPHRAFPTDKVAREPAFAKE
jgi:hypothetical protein